jgi:succinate-semialdehyde dehydrogenase/glutarate-semialdehyde dehydrogenase
VVTQTATEHVSQPINPRWRDLARLVTTAGERELREIRSPIDQTVIGDVPIGAPEDVALAARTARAAQVAWARRPLADRCAVIANFKRLLLEYRDDLLDLVHVENGKSRINAFEEFLDCVLTAAYYAHSAPRHLRKRRRLGAIPGLTSTYEHFLPKGLVGIISPWNYPLTLAASDAVPALLAGNAVVIKPDSATPFTALAVARLFHDAGVPPDVFQVVTGPGSELGTPLVNAVDYMMFTGSTATGARVAAQCGERLIGCSAELGGKNAMLVLDDAVMARTVPGAVQACFSTSGQLCVSIERIYVNGAVYDEFLSAFAAAVRAIKLGGAPTWDIDMGPLISPQQLAIVERHVDDAVAKGATVVTGGRPRPDLGPLFYEPTVLTGVTEEMEIARSETFGPVVSVYRVATDEEAIARANDTKYGLNASIWTGSLAHGRYVAERLRAGTCNINEGYAAAWASHDSSMGGMGTSGLGRRHGREGIIKYTEPQTVSTEHLMALAPPPFISRETYAKAMSLGGALLHRFPFALPVPPWWTRRWGR